MDEPRTKKPDDASGDEDQDLFRNTISGVSTLKQDRIKPYRPARKPIPEQRLLDEKRVMDELLGDSIDEASFGSGDEISWLKSGYPRKLLRRLRRGHYAIQAEFDLHGYTLAQAKQELHEFLLDCAAGQLGCVRVIHGKGLGSPGRTPVIKGKILRWLAHNDDVLAVCSAPARDGGTGAVYVLLRG